MLTLVQRELRKLATPQRAKSNAWFFKTAPGEYGFGDQFIGVKVPGVRTVARRYQDLNFRDLEVLLESAVHEDRLLGLIILTNQYEKEPDARKKNKILRFYLKKKSRINNWDLVDLTAHKILGEHSYRTKNTQTLWKLLVSKRHWDRRMAIVGTAYFIKKGDLDLTFEFAQKLLRDQEDLMHKATGWMLREAGKRSRVRLKQFLQEHGSKMPRTMLRYAIERFPEAERQKILATTRNTQHNVPKEKKLVVK